MSLTKSKFKLRAPVDDDEDDNDWWFAGVLARPLAATIAPFGVVFSIASLVTSWRMSLGDGQGNRPLHLSDPRWLYGLKTLPLVSGVLGETFLLLHLSGRVRYLFAVSVSMVCFFAGAIVVVGITASLHIYAPPSPPLEAYSQGYWYAVIVAVLIFICSILLLYNLVGYFLGHYPQHFSLSNHQRTLIYQAVLFSFWIAGGAAVFAHVESEGQTSHPWAFVDGLFFCDTTMLTIGLHDLYPQSDLGRALVFPFALVGIIFLGFLVVSVHGITCEVGSKNRRRTHMKTIPIPPRTVRIEEPTGKGSSTLPHTSATMSNAASMPPDLERGETAIEKTSLPTFVMRTSRRPWSQRQKFILMREEKDRFEAMRKIKEDTERFKKWWRFFLSMVAVGILWCVGAVVIWAVEKDEQQMTYFQSLYLCYTTLLTIGYGDLVPRSPAGRAFFVVWSLAAVPTMTVLVSTATDTVFYWVRKHIYISDRFLYLEPWMDLLAKFPPFQACLERRRRAKQLKRRLRGGLPFDPLDPERPAPLTLADLAEESEAGMSEEEALKRLVWAVRRVTDATAGRTGPVRYSYEDWVEFTRLIRITRNSLDEEEEEGFLEWDWLADDSPFSPFMSRVSESEWILDRLCESLLRGLGHLARRGIADDSTLKPIRRVVTNEDYFGSKENLGRDSGSDNDDDGENQDENETEGSRDHDDAVS